jgi:hypothetical protein
MLTVCACGVAGPLFVMMRPDALRKPTYKAFHALLDNYEREIGKTEHVTAAQRRENQEFVRLCMRSKCMKYVHQFLKRARRNGRSLFSGDESSFEVRHAFSVIACTVWISQWVATVVAG